MKFSFNKKFFGSLIPLLLFSPVLVGCSKLNTSNLPSKCSNNLLPCLIGTAVIEISTNQGSITVEINGESSPVTGGNFLDLVNRGVFDGTIFHRVIKEPIPFVVQGGDPFSKDSNTPKTDYGSGNFIDKSTGQPRYIPLEIKLKTEVLPRYGQLINNTSQLELTHQRGSLAMARSQNLDSASAQFYIALRPLPELDGRYAVFGRVIKGMDVVDRINQEDRIIKANLLKLKMR